MKISATHHIHVVAGGYTADAGGTTLTTTGIRMRKYGGVEILLIATDVTVTDTNTQMSIMPFENTSTAAGGSAISDADGNALTFSATANAASLCVVSGYVDASLLQGGAYEYICAKVTGAAGTCPTSVILMGVNPRYAQQTTTE